MAKGFGTDFGSAMAVARFVDGAWTDASMERVAPISVHPAAHALHYGSTCFEGIKAHRGVDDAVRLFRPGRHARRMGESAGLLHLPRPDPTQLQAMILDTARANIDRVPTAPASLYLRPVLMGTDANIGAAAAPSTSALLYVLPVVIGEYFVGSIRLKVETQLPRTTPQFGQAKAGANYVMALGPTLEAKAEFGIDQVLFASGGVLAETGAANVLLIDEDRIVTPALCGALLHGVTRDSILTLARDRGMEVEEREVTVGELRSWIARSDAEVALSGTAAVLAGVGGLVIGGEEHHVGTGDVGPVTQMLREALVEIQLGKAEDTHGWTAVVDPR